MCGYTHNFKMAASKSKWPQKKQKQKKQAILKE